MAPRDALGIEALYSTLVFHEQHLEDITPSYGDRL